MKLVVDANIVIAALIRDSTSRKLFFLSRFNFIIPDIYLEEILKYKDYIKEKTSLKEEEFDELLSLVMKYITVVPYDKYSKFMKETLRVMAKIDEKDAPYVALALASKADGIWSEDKDFKRQSKVKVLDTSEVLALLRKF